VSSHHFVKEGQEPALLILEALSHELAEPLLEWAPLVVVADTALADVLQWNIKIDVVLVQAIRKEEVKAQLLDQFPIEIITYRDHSDFLSVAFNFLIAKNQKALNVMTDASDSLFISVKPFTEKIQISLFNQHIQWLYISSGHYEKWLPAKSLIQVIKKEDQKIQCTGLLPQQEHWEVENDGMVGIHSDRVFWVGELSE